MVLLYLDLVCNSNLRIEKIKLDRNNMNIGIDQIIKSIIIIKKAIYSFFLIFNGFYIF